MQHHFLDGVDPREYLTSHKERGPKQHTYTAQDVADLLGVSLKTVYNMKTRKGAQRLDITSLDSICRAYARKRLGYKSGTLRRANIPE